MIIGDSVEFKLVIKLSQIISKKFIPLLEQISTLLKSLPLKPLVKFRKSGSCKNLLSKKLLNQKISYRICFNFCVLTLCARRISVTSSSQNLIVFPRLLKKSLKSAIPWIGWILELIILDLKYFLIAKYSNYLKFYIYLWATNDLDRQLSEQNF